MRAISRRPRAGRPGCPAAPRPAARPRRTSLRRSASTVPSGSAIAAASAITLRRFQRTLPVTTSGRPSGTGARKRRSIAAVMPRSPTRPQACAIASSSSIITIPPWAIPRQPWKRGGSVISARTASAPAGAKRRCSPSAANGPQAKQRPSSTGSRRSLLLGRGRRRRRGRRARLAVGAVVELAQQGAGVGDVGCRPLIEARSTRRASSGFFCCM